MWALEGTELEVRCQAHVSWLGHGPHQVILEQPQRSASRDLGHLQLLLLPPWKVMHTKALSALPPHLLCARLGCE